MEEREKLDAEFIQAIENMSDDHFWGWTRDWLSTELIVKEALMFEDIDKIEFIQKRKQILREEDQCNICKKINCSCDEDYENSITEELY